MKKQMKVTGTTFSLLGFDELENKFTISTICGNLVIIPKVLPYQFLRFSFDGIIDSATATGAVNYIKELLQSRNPASIKIAALLDKPSRRKVDLQADYVGFVVPDEFVIGYGLDFDEKYRNLPYIGVLKPEVYSN